MAHSKGKLDFMLDDEEYGGTCGHDIEVREGVLVLTAYNEGGSCQTNTDLDELVDYVMRKFPDRFGSSFKTIKYLKKQVSALTQDIQALRQEIHNERSESFAANQKVDALAEKLELEIVSCADGVAKVFNIPAA